MATRIAKYISIATLLIAILLRSHLGYRVVVAFVIFWGAIMVARQAARAQKYLWVSAFVVIAVVFNPIWMVSSATTFSLWLDVGCLLTFAASLILLKSKPLLSIPSITDRTPGSESL